MTTVTTDDFAANASTSGVVPIGGQISGNLETSGDRDWFKVTLAAGTTYLFELDGADAGGGTLATLPFLRWLDSAGNYIDSTSFGGPGNTPLSSFTPASSGTYYLEVGAAGSGTYRLKASVAPLQDDFAGGVTTAGTLAVGGAAAHGNIEYPNDRDWFKVTLVAGTVYRFTLGDAANGGGTLGAGDIMAELIVMDGSGRSRLASGASDIRAAPYVDYTPVTSGTYFVNVGDVFHRGTGTYTVTATQIGTLDLVPPRATGFSPGNGAAVTTPITITFSEPVLRGSGNLVLRDAADQPVAMYDIATSANIIVSGNTLTLVPALSLPAGMQFTVSVPVGAVIDGGKNLSGPPTTYQFTTAGDASAYVGTQSTGRFSTLVTGTAANNVLVGSAGNDTLDGGAGTDLAVFSGKFSDHQLSALPGSPGTYTLADPRPVNSSTGMDTLVGIERLQFVDEYVALDLGAGQAGGKAALMLATLLGAAGVANKGLAGTFLRYFDTGASLQDGATLLVDSGIAAAFAGGPDNASFVKFLYHNLNGSLPDAATLAALVAPLDAHTTTQAQWMASLAATQAYALPVLLAGLAANGLEYL